MPGPTEPEGEEIEGEELDALLEPQGEDVEIRPENPWMSGRRELMSEEDAADELAEGGQPAGRELILPTTEIVAGGPTRTHGQAEQMRRVVPASEIQRLTDPNTPRAKRGEVSQPTLTPQDPQAGGRVDLPEVPQGLQTALNFAGSFGPAALLQAASGAQWDPGAAAVGATDVLTAGNMDQMVGVAATMPPGSFLPEPERYRPAQQSAERRALDVMQEAPGSYGVGAAAGAGLAMAAPNPAALGSTRGARIALGAGEGAGMAGAAGLGHSQATVEWPAELARDVSGSYLGGAALGAAGQGASEASGAALQRLAGGGADRQRLAALGARSGDLRNIERSVPGGTARMADVARREGLTSVAGTIDDMQPAVSATRRRALEQIQGVTGSSLTQNPAAVRQGVVGRMGDLLDSNDDATRRAGESILRIVDNATESGPVDMSALQALKQDLRRLGWSPATSRPMETARGEAARRAYSAVARAMDDAVEFGAGPGTGSAATEQYQQAREAYNLANRAERWGSDAASRGAGNRAVSPTDYLAGAGTFAATGDPVTAGVAALGNRTFRAREHSLFATGLERIQALAQRGQLGPNLAAAARRSPAEFAAQYYVATSQGQAPQMDELDDMEDDDVFDPFAGEQEDPFDPFAEDTP